MSAILTDEKDFCYEKIEWIILSKAQWENVKNVIEGLLESMREEQPILYCNALQLLPLDKNNQIDYKKLIKNALQDNLLYGNKSKKQLEETLLFADFSTLVPFYLLHLQVNVQNLQSTGLLAQTTEIIENTYDIYLSFTQDVKWQLKKEGSDKCIPVSLSLMPVNVQAYVAQNFKGINKEYKAKLKDKNISLSLDYHPVVQMWIYSGYLCEAIDISSLQVDSLEDYKNSGNNCTYYDHIPHNFTMYFSKSLEMSLFPNWTEIIGIKQEEKVLHMRLYITGRTLSKSRNIYANSKALLPIGSRILLELKDLQSGSKKRS